MDTGKCGMLVDCPAIDDAKRLNQRLMAVDLIRELTRNMIGLIAVPGILYMLYRFVEMSPADDRMNIMLLVIGYLGGLATGITTYYFGGAMRSAVQAALQNKGGIINAPENPPEVPPQPVVLGPQSAAPADAPGGVSPEGTVDPGGAGGGGQPQDPSLESPNDGQANLRLDLPDAGPAGQAGKTTGWRQGTGNPSG